MNMKPLTKNQQQVLEWIKQGCPEGVYADHSHRISARVLHNRNLVRITGRGKSWSASLTPEGHNFLTAAQEQERLQQLQEQEEKQQQVFRQRQDQIRQERARALLQQVIDHQGHLDLGLAYSHKELTQILQDLDQTNAIPHGKRMLIEPMKMDPSLGYALHLAPDFSALIPKRPLSVAQQIRNPHLVIQEFQQRREFITQSQIPRAARILHTLVKAALERGWKVKAATASPYVYRSNERPDLLLRLPNIEVQISVRELDRGGRAGKAFVTERSYFSEPERIVKNSYFSATGRLVLNAHVSSKEHPFWSTRDLKNDPVENHLGSLIHQVEVRDAQEAWEWAEQRRHDEIRSLRWGEVKAEALEKLTYQRNVELLQHQLHQRRTAAEIRSYVHEIQAGMEERSGQDHIDALAWIQFALEYAQAIDPLQGSLKMSVVTSASQEELEPYMNGWSATGQYRRSVR